MIPGLVQWVKIASIATTAACVMAATVQIQSLARELPYAMGMAEKAKKRERKSEKENPQKMHIFGP